MKSVLEVSRLTKQFGPFTAVDDISLHHWRREIVGLLGPKRSREVNYYVYAS